MRPWTISQLELAHPLPRDGVWKWAVSDGGMPRAVGYMGCMIFTAPAANGDGRVLCFTDDDGKALCSSPPEHIALAVLLASTGRDYGIAAGLEAELKRAKRAAFLARRNRKHALANRFEGECHALRLAAGIVRNGTIQMFGAGGIDAI